MFPHPQLNSTEYLLKLNLQSELTTVNLVRALEVFTADTGLYTQEDLLSDARRIWSKVNDAPPNDLTLEAILHYPFVPRRAERRLAAPYDPSDFVSAQLDQVGSLSLLASQTYENVIWSQRAIFGVSLGSRKNALMPCTEMEPSFALRHRCPSVGKPTVQGV
jgi:hypothetical protein